MTKRPKHWHGPITLCADLTENLNNYRKTFSTFSCLHFSTYRWHQTPVVQTKVLIVLWGRFWDFAMTLGLKNVGHFVRNFPGTSFTFCLYWNVTFILSFTRALTTSSSTQLCRYCMHSNATCQLEACRGKSQGHLEEWSKVKIANALNKLVYT